jgi:hypothetical protein
LIIRVLTVHVAAPNVSEANGLMRELLAELRAQHGLAYAKLARRLLENDDEEMVLIEEWLTPADLFEWTGGMLQRPRLPVNAPALFENVAITHYESLDRLPQEMELDVMRSDPSSDGFDGSDAASGTAPASNRSAADSA